MLTSETVKYIRTDGDKTIVTTSNGAEISADGVVAGLGILPNTELAVQAGLSVDNGMLVDELLRTSNHDIYAAGDVANFHNSIGQRSRVEHEDNANVMGDMGRAKHGRRIGPLSSPAFLLFRPVRPRI